MWDEWRALIDRSLRDAELARDHWYDHEFRFELRSDPDAARARFRLLSERPAVAGPRATARSHGWWERAAGRALPRQAR